MFLLLAERTHTSETSCRIDDGVGYRAWPPSEVSLCFGAGEPTLPAQLEQLTANLSIEEADHFYQPVWKSSYRDFAGLAS